MFTEEMVEDTYGILTDHDDYIYIDTAVAMTLDSFCIDFEWGDETFVAYHKYYTEKATEIFGGDGQKY